MLKLERQRTNAVNVAIILTELKLNLQAKKVSNYVSYQTKCTSILEKLEKDEKVDTRVFLQEKYLNLKISSSLSGCLQRCDTSSLTKLK